MFVNAVLNETSKVAPEFIAFAGTFVSLPHGVWPVMRKSSLKLGISELLQDLEADEDESIWVTLVPRFNCMNITIDGIKIEEVKLILGSTPNKTARNNRLVVAFMAVYVIC